MTLHLVIDLWCKVWGSLAAFAIVFPIGLIVTAYVANMVREIMLHFSIHKC